MRARGILCDNERTLMKNGMRAGWINFRRARINLQPAVNFSGGIRILIVISHCNSSHKHASSLIRRQDRRNNSALLAESSIVRITNFYSHHWLSTQEMMIFFALRWLRLQRNCTNPTNSRALNSYINSG